MNTIPADMDCPKCNGVLVYNEQEGCKECHTCGYIHCGDE